MNILSILLVFAQQRPLTGLDAYVSKAITDWRVPGLAIVVVKDDSVVFIKGYGVRELGKPEPVTVHTRFGNMSTTKAFTAMLVAMLADSGTLAFDDPVQKYEPAGAMSSTPSRDAGSTRTVSRTIPCGDETSPTLAALSVAASG